MLKRSLFLLVVVLLFTTGCIRYKNITYLQDHYENDSVKLNLSISIPEEIVLETGNNLYIKLSGVEGYQIESFVKDRVLNSNYNELMLYFQGYLIEDDGYVDLPVVGKVQVVGKTFKQAKKLIQERYAEFLKDIIVDVRLVSYDITLMGEINRPGQYTFYKPNINILEALAKGGNIGNYGDIRNVLVIRNKGELSETVKVDLTNSNLFKNTHFWLEPGDVVYVKPVRAKIFSVNSTTISLFFSTLSLLIVAATFVKSF